MKTIDDRQKENARYQAELISMLMNDESLYFKTVDIIKPELFTGTIRSIFDAYEALVVENSKPDAARISNKGNIPLSDIVNIINSPTGISNDINVLVTELHEYLVLTQLSMLAAHISREVAAGTESEYITEHISQELRKLELGTKSKVITMEAGVSELLKTINSNLLCKSPTGCPVGMEIIDDHMDGLQAGDLIILAGETSHGKTSLALSMAFNSAVRFNQRCGILSYEMTSNQLVARLSSYTTGLGNKQLLTGKLTEAELSTFENKIDKLRSANIFIQGYNRRELSDTISAIRLLVLQHQIKWIVVENAGNISVKGKTTDEQRTAEISKSLKALAMDLNITIILISHLSKEKDPNKGQPDLSRLKHSGQLEADADVVLFVYRAIIHEQSFSPDEKKSSAAGQAKVYIAKGRNYGLKTVYMNFDENLTYFSDLNHQNESPGCSTGYAYTTNRLDPADCPF